VVRPLHPAAFSSVRPLEKDAALEVVRGDQTDTAVVFVRPSKNYSFASTCVVLFHATREDNNAEAGSRLNDHTKSAFSM